MNRLWKIRNKERSKIALHIGGEMNRIRADRKESQFAGGGQLSASYLEVTPELLSAHL